MAWHWIGIHNINEYLSNYYLFNIFEKDLNEKVSSWIQAANASAENLNPALGQTNLSPEAFFPWNKLKEFGRSFNAIRERGLRLGAKDQPFSRVTRLANQLLPALGYPTPDPFSLAVEKVTIPVYSKVVASNGDPLLWVLLTVGARDDETFLRNHSFDGGSLNQNSVPLVTGVDNERLIQKIFFRQDSSPRWLLFVGIDGLALIDRNAWHDKKYLQFDLTEIFRRREEITIQAMALLLHRQSICPEDNLCFLDELKDNSRQHSEGVSEDLKFAVREAIELLVNEVLHSLTQDPGKSPNAANLDNRDLGPVDPDGLTKECLRYVYRLIVVFFIESKPELGYAPMKSPIYLKGYSLAFLREIVENFRLKFETADEDFLHQSLTKLFGLVYNGYQDKTPAAKNGSDPEVYQNIFVIEPLKTHIFDPDYTPTINKAKIRDSVMLKIIDLLSISRAAGRGKGRRGRICYATLGINQLGAVYEELLSYRGFIAKENLAEVKRAKAGYGAREVRYFVP
ncbi:MAG: class I SAM-dependent DNA methyltransferase, partial [Deltaproteobacteria bacterium]|nr:class I SAM-dependent DNA methyltransferase [Deltaproteobacteria bacterium]